MPGARMLKMVVMKLIAPSSELMPARCSANSVQSMPDAGLVGRVRERRIQRPAGAGFAQEQAGHDQHERRHQQPEADVVQARERHVGRADHQRHEPVAEAADQSPA